MLMFEGDHELPENTKNELLRMHDWLRTAFPLVHEHLERETVGEYSLLFAWKSTKQDPLRKPVLLCAHMDVVDVDPISREQWLEDPFSGAFRDGFIYGRGTLDFKVSKFMFQEYFRHFLYLQNGVIGTLEAVETLLSQGALEPSRTVYLAFGHDEEIMGLNGASKMAALFRERNIEFEFILDEGEMNVFQVIHMR
jgi:carboxypeptidase PM20D1